MKKATGFDLREIKVQVARILKVWKANREFRLSDARLEHYQKLYADLEAILKKIATQNRELDESRKIRDRLALELSQLTTRARSGMRGYFGPRSSQYGQIKGSQSRAKAVHKTRTSAAAKSESPPAPPGD